MADPKKQPIDLTRRTLVRIFSEGRFDSYRGWWQNVPSEYRPFITMRAKRRAMISRSSIQTWFIFLREWAMRTLMTGCLTVTTEIYAFNAMMQSSTPLLKEPEDIDLSEVDFDWPFLRQAILMPTNPSKICSLRDMETTFNTSTVLWQRRLCKFAKSDYPPVLPMLILCSTHLESQMRLRRICGDFLWSLQKGYFRCHI